jgi:hypothetical protein
MTDISIQELRQIAKLGDMDLSLALMEYRAGEADAGYFCNLVDTAIDRCAREMSRYPKELGPLGEDQLSINLIGQLKMLGFKAEHDATTGGHCDIVITEFGGLMWLGEAKKLNGAEIAKVRDGYNQLMDRYSTGLPYQDRGAVIMFCNAPRVDEILSSWRDYLLSNYDKVSIVEYKADELWFSSTTVHHRTGITYNVRHKPISLYFKPAAEKAA